MLRINTFKTNTYRVIQRLSMLLLVFVFSDAVFANSTRGLSVGVRASESRDAPVVEQVELYTVSYALVIGNDAYNNGWPPLANAVKDAELISEALEAKGFEVELHKNLTSDELNSVFKRFFILKGDEPEARLFVWYAGHGATVDGEGYLIPIDAPVPSVGGLFKLSSTALRDFGTYMRQAQSKHAYAVFDSCFAGTVFTSQRDLPPAAITRATTMPVRQFLTSGDADQTVSDDGTFRDLFIKAINGQERSDSNSDGYVTGSELGMFLGDRVTNLTESMQTPRYGKLRDKDFDRGDFVFRLPTTPIINVAPAGQPPLSSPQKSNATEITFWNSIKDSGSADQYEAYIKSFPAGSFVKLAQIRVKALTKKPASKVVPVRLAEETKVARRQNISIRYRDENFEAAKVGNIRSGPYENANRVGRLQKGDKVWVVGETNNGSGDWYRVAKDGMELGYVFSSLLEQSSEQASGGTSVEIADQTPDAELTETEGFVTAKAEPVVVPAQIDEQPKVDRWSQLELQMSEEVIETEENLEVAVDSDPAQQPEQPPAETPVQLQENSKLARYIALGNDNNIEAQLYLGDVFYSGVDTAVDYKRALHWYEQAANNGNVSAQLNLATMYEQGEGIPVDLKSSAYWVMQAANQGSGQALQMLGYMYETGSGVEKDFEKAIKYYETASEMNLPIAQHNLGRLHQLGLGTPIDLSEAKRLYELAATNGNKDAELKLSLFK